MKTSHVIFFIILFLILRNKATTTQPAPAVTTTGGSDPALRTDTTLRRDMEEQVAMLQSQIDELKKSPYQ